MSLLLQLSLDPDIRYRGTEFWVNRILHFYVRNRAEMSLFIVLCAGGEYGEEGEGWRGDSGAVCSPSGAQCERRSCQTTW